MSDPDIEKSYCKFCRLELHSSNDISLGFHQSCENEVEAYSSSETMMLSQLINFFPDHELKIYVDSHFPFTDAKKVSYNDIESLQQRLNLYQTQFSSKSKFIIMILFNRQIVALHINDVNTFPEFILTMQSLRYLTIHFLQNSEKCESISVDNLSSLIGLTILSNSHQPFPIIRNKSGSSTLKYLALKHFGPQWVTTVPDGIESLHKLEILVLEFPLKEYPTSLCYLPKLQFLRLFSTKTNWNIVIPNTIVNLRQLRAMQIEGSEPDTNEKTDMIETVNSIELHNVTVEDKLLPLDTLFITSFALGYDELFPILAFRRLHQLFLINNHIDEISDELLIFVNLIRLDLSFNDIKFIPEKFQWAKKLREIYLANNKLTDFETLCLIRHISIIDVQENNISEFPLKIVKKRIKQFELIDIQGNGIELIPNLPFVKF